MQQSVASMQGARGGGGMRADRWADPFPKCIVIEIPASKEGRGEVRLLILEF